MKYTVISAYCGDKFWDADSKKRIDAALANSKGNYIEIAPTIWVFKTEPGYAGHVALSEFLTRQNRTFVQLSCDSPPKVSIAPHDLPKFQAFLND